MLQLVQAMRLLIVTGEVLLYRVDSSIRIYSLRDYTLKRNHLGDVLDVSFGNTSTGLSYQITSSNNVVGAKPSDDKVKIYTRVQRQEKNGHVSWKVTQEINGRDIGTDAVSRQVMPVHSCNMELCKW